MKKLIIVFSVCLWGFQLYARQDPNLRIDPSISSYDNALYQQKHADSLLVIVGQFITPVIFDVDKYDIRTTPQLEEAIDSIINCNNTLDHIWIKGSASPEGPLKWNQKLGQYRAEALTGYIARETGLERRMFRIHNLGEDWSSLQEALENHADFPNKERILAILYEHQDNEVRKRKIRELDGGKSWRRLVRELFPPLRNARLAIVSAYPKLSPVSPGIALQIMQDPFDPYDLPLPGLIPVPARDIAERPDWKIAVKTNLLFDVALVANLGVEISPWKHWSLDIPVWYSPYNIASTRKIRLLAVQPEFRWWPEEAMSGHYFGLHTHVAGFNIALNDYARYQDPNSALWGVGLGYGYAMSLGKGGHWVLEFNLGAGFAKYRYDAYRNWNDGPKFKSGSDCYWGITRAGVTLSYKFYLSRKDRKK